MPRWFAYRFLPTATPNGASHLELHERNHPHRDRQARTVIDYGNPSQIMPLTGRAVRCRKALAESAKAIDMTFLRKKGFFTVAAGSNWTSSWTSRGEPSGTVSYWREDYLGEPIFLWFSYNVRKDGEEWRPVKYGIEIDSTQCQFGGQRYWFVCPLVVNGVACGRRCRALYLGGSDYFGCRECQRLTYESRRKHRDKFWELWGKHDAYMERTNTKYKPPRGRKAKGRRRRLSANAQQAMRYGDMMFARLL